MSFLFIEGNIMKIHKLFLALLIPAVTVAMESDDEGMSPEEYTQMLTRQISLAESIMKGKTFEAIGPDYIAYPHYQDDPNHSITYIQHRDIARQEMKDIKKATQVDYYRFGLIMALQRICEQNQELDNQEVAAKLDLRIKMAFQADRLSDFLDSSKCELKDLSRENRDQWPSIKNRKKLLASLKNGSREQINTACATQLHTDPFADLTTSLLANITEIRAGGTTDESKALCGFAKGIANGAQQNVLAQTITMIKAAYGQQ